MLCDRTTRRRSVVGIGLSIAIAVLAVLIKYWDYVANPWTRDGQVRADIVQITPRISGPIVKLPIVDNQFVKAGDLLFEIDPRTFQAAVDKARAAAKPPRLTRSMQASAPPQTAMSASPAWIIRAASPMAWTLAAQAVTGAPSRST